MATSRLLTTDLAPQALGQSTGPCRKHVLGGSSLSLSGLDLKVLQAPYLKGDACLLRRARDVERSDVGVMRVQCRAADSYATRTAANNGALSSARRQSTRRQKEREQDLQFALELRQVMDARGLPKLTVPTPQQLSDRPDLAKGVRMRGDFHVARLLGDYAALEEVSPPTSDGQMSTFEEGDPGYQINDFQSLRPQGPPPIPKAPSFNGEGEHFGGNLGRDTKIVEKFEAQPGARNRAPQRGGRELPARDAQATGEAVDRLKKLGGFMDSSGASSGPSLGERAARFLQTGKMDEFMQADASQFDFTEGMTSDDEDADGPNSESIAAQKAALLKAKLQQRIDDLQERVVSKASVLSNHRSAGLPTAPVLDTLQSQNERLFQEILSEQQQLQQMGLSERQFEDDFKAQTFNELQRIKDVLGSRETEVASMAEALKEARAQLNLLRAKSAAELSQARQEVLELQTRLKNAEKALEGLKQVRVEYWGQGESVELAGSFNGWGGFLTMEPDLSTEIPSPEGGRGPMVFGCDMRLYPGEYEIKFIVDGEWQVDSRREIVSKGLVQNNLLRVE